MVAFDMRDAVMAPEFMDSFQVIRRNQAVNNYGRAQNTPQFTANAVGVVTPASAKQLERLPDMQYIGKALSIVTTYPIQGPTPGVDPDLIVWNGDNFVVQLLDDASNYGPGFVTVVCTSIDSTELPPQAPGVGQP